MDERLIQEAIDMLEAIKQANIRDINIDLSKYDDDGTQCYSLTIDVGSGTFIKTKDGDVFVNN